MVPRIGVVATIRAIASVPDFDARLAEAAIYWIGAMRLQLSKRENEVLADFRELLSKPRS